MANNNFIPAGRTSLVGQGEVKLQVQTEYADRPYPRITTTILDSGQVLHKVEKKLGESIGSTEEQKRMQDIMARQHAEIVAVIDRRSGEKVRQAPDSPPTPTENPSLRERMEEVNGVHRVYQLDNDGNLINQDVSVAFRLNHVAIFENLCEMATLFEQIPDTDGQRLSGVRAIQANRLYLASSGESLYFVVIQTPVDGVDYRAELEHTLAD